MNILLKSTAMNAPTLNINTTTNNSSLSLNNNNSNILYSPTSSSTSSSSSSGTSSNQLNNIQIKSLNNALSLSLGVNQTQQSLNDGLNGFINNNSRGNTTGLNNSTLNTNLILMQKAAGVTTGNLTQNLFQFTQQQFQQQTQVQQQPTCSLNNTLFVGNLHASLQEIDLIQVFRPFGNIVECCKKWLHFGFVKFTTEEEACHAYVTLNGFRLKGRPMRLEFQNRTKKARIKAIIAQANLQSTGNSNNLSLTNDGFSLGSFQLSDDRQHNQQQFNQQQQQQQQQQQLNNLKSSFIYQQNSLIECLNKKLESKIDNTNLFNAEQLIKFASGIIDLDKDPNGQQKLHQPFEFNFDLNDLPILDNTNNTISKLDNNNSRNDEILLNLVKKTISPIDSPQHDLSSSSDSGCRSASFIADCDDSAIISTAITANLITSSTSKQQKSIGSESFLEKNSVITQIQKQINDEITISEHLEFTCSSKSLKPNVISNENLSDNIKIIDENDKEVNKQIELNDLGVVLDENDDDVNDNTSDCDSDCDTSDDASEFPLDSDCLNDLDLMEFNDLNKNDFADLNRYSQVMEKDGTMAKKKLKYGCIYRSINQTMSLFIEPNDILKQMDSDEYDEYVLFPNDEIESSSPYFDDNLNTPCIDSNITTSSECLESFHLVIKNHFYL